MELVKSGLLVHYETISGPFCPKKSDFRQKTSHIHQIWTFECKIRPFLDLFSQYSHILDSLEKLTILELFGDRGKRPCFQWSFWPFHRITDYIILYSLLVIISSHFCEIPTFWVQKQTNFGPFFFKKSDFNQESKIFRLFWTTGKGPWFQSYFSTFQDVIDYVPILSNSTVNKLKFLKGCN